MVAVTELMSRYCDGDACAFRELYGRLAPCVYQSLAGLTGNDELARALLEQAFLTFHRSRRAYIRGADPIPWIQAIARQTFIDHRDAGVRRYAG